jgi:hypothetical protein
MSTGRRWRAGLGGLAIGLLSLGALGSTAVHAISTEGRLVSATAVREANESNAYFACLTGEAHSLFHSGDVVFLGEPNLDRWVTVEKVVGGWAHLTLHQSQATVAVLLLHASRGPSCEGDVFLSIRRLAHHTVRMVRATQSTP